MAEGSSVAQPSFSFIIPTDNNTEELEATLLNLICQQCDVEGMPLEREFIVVGDGPSEETKESLGRIAQAMHGLNHLSLKYMHLLEPVRTGDIPRRIGLKQATKDWVVFADAGTSYMRGFMSSLWQAAIQPDAKIITWDMYQQLQPQPGISQAQAVLYVDRTQGLPYVFPGCATAVRRDIAQQVDWPVCKASDWVYFSNVWDLLYLKKDEQTGELTRTDTEEAINRDVVIIPWVLNCAYGNKTERKWRVFPTQKELEAEGWDKGHASETVNEQKPTDPEPIQGTEEPRAQATESVPTDAS